MLATTVSMLVMAIMVKFCILLALPTHILQEAWKMLKPEFASYHLLLLKKGKLYG